MADARKKRIILAAGIWIVILGGASVTLKIFVWPSQQKKLVLETGSASQYRHELTGGHDLFPGYAPARSELQNKHLKTAGIKLTWEDDEADYVKRITKLRDGDLDVAVFTIDALITASIEIGEWPPPATIFAVVDQTKGADGLVAWKADVPAINALDNEDARIVCTPKSPSELIARVVVGQFSLPRLPDDWMIEADGSKDVLAKIKKYRGKPYAFALWEPELSQALEMDGVHVLIDSSKLDGLIVDVLVANREFVANQPDLVKSVGEAYLRASYSYGKSGMVDLIAKDAGLNQDQAQRIVDGIQWTNTMENFAHFGLASGGQHLEDIIINITNVLVATGALPEQNPVRGTESNLYYDQMLASLQADGFHPARKLNVLGNMAGMAGLDAVRSDDDLPALTDDEWNELVGVGNIKVNKITFGRGSSNINVGGQRELRDLTDRLSSFPQYYLLVVGNATAKGDPAANLALAQQRSDAVKEYLSTLGVTPNRLKAMAGAPNNRTTSSVSFIVGQRPY
jgi:outer membrane protein OmpA-like peptidoglycan-associated protein